MTEELFRQLRTLQDVWDYVWSGYAVPSTHDAVSCSAYGLNRGCRWPSRNRGR
jgi:hypothetical protein